MLKQTNIRDGGMNRIFILSNQEYLELACQKDLEIVL